jgi:catechol 2,3-dioxygenase-like lactoylglutathione lyase family enzyme
MSLQHVSVEVRPGDVPAEQAFWGLLGFEPVDPPGSLGQKSSWVQRNGTQIHFLFADEPVKPPEGHVAVVAEDWDDAIARLREAGFTPEEHERHWGAARAFVTTPAGHLVEVMAAPPA